MLSLKAPPCVTPVSTNIIFPIILACHTHIPQRYLYNHSHLSHIHPPMLSLQTPSSFTPTSSYSSISLNIIFAVTLTYHTYGPKHDLPSHTHLSHLRPSTFSLQSHSPVRVSQRGSLFKLPATTQSHGLKFIKTRTGTCFKNNTAMC